MTDINKTDSINKEIEQPQIDIWDWAIAIGKEKITIIVIFGFFIVSSIVYSLITTPSYTAKTILLPSGAQQGGPTAVGMINAFATNFGGGGSVKSKEEYYSNLLQSEALQNEVIKKLNLLNYFNTNLFIDARTKLKSMVKVSLDKKAGFVVVEVESNDPEFSAVLANNYVQELRNLLGKLNYEELMHRLQFYEKAIAKSQIDLNLARAKFQNAKGKSLVISEAGMTESLYTQISQRELQIKALSHFSTQINPDIRRLEAENSALREQLFNINQNSSVSEKSDLNHQLALDAYREIKSFETILTALTSQYKISITESIATDPSIQQIQIAIPPEIRSKPVRSTIVVNYSLIGLVVSFIIALVKIKLRKLDLTTIQKLMKLKNAWFSLKA